MIRSHAPSPSLQAYHVDRLLTVAYLLPSLAVLAFFVHTHGRVAQRSRVMAGFAVFVVATGAMPLIDLFPAGPGTLGAMLVLVAATGVADGAAQGALFGEAAALDGRHTQALVASTAVSGVAVSLLRVLTKAVLPDTPAGLRASADLYFFIAAAWCAGCLVVYAAVLPRLRREAAAAAGGPTVIFNSGDGDGGGGGPPSVDTKYSGPDEGEAEPEGASDSEAAALVHFDTFAAAAAQPSYLVVAWEVRYLVAALIAIYTVTLSIFPGVLAEDISSAALGSWYPVVLMAVYNAADCGGKWAPAVPALRLRRPGAILGAAGARVLFVPAFHFAATRGAGGAAMGALAVALGGSNGYLTSAAMMLGPRLVEPRAAALSGNVMVLSLVAGLCVGAVAGFLWLL